MPLNEAFRLNRLEYGRGRPFVSGNEATANLCSGLTGTGVMIRQHALSRTELLIGKEALETLAARKVVVLGIGGVGSYSVEALARCGVGRLVIVDDDTICITNLNRQIHATRQTLGMRKVDAMKERVHGIDSRISVDARHLCVSPDSISSAIDDDADYVIDALDTISAKLAAVEFCFHRQINIVSCMGTGNKLDPTRFVVGDVFKTKVCPLAKVMRNELRRRNIPRLTVVYSEETPMKPRESEVATCKDACICDDQEGRKCSLKRQIPASISFVPPVAGFILAGKVIRDLAGL